MMGNAAYHPNYWMPSIFDDLEMQVLHTIDFEISPFFKKTTKKLLDKIGESIIVLFNN